ncbi:MAG: Tfx family DNA-binding protein [Sulfolobales archaeon]
MERDEKKKYGLLTEKQYEVLRLRALGYRQKEIAEMMSTTRENISVIEKSALRKIKLAEETIRLYRELYCLDKIRVEPNTYTLDIPKIIFSRADELGIKLKANLSYLLGAIHYRAGGCIKRRHLIKPLNILIFKDGDIEIYCDN